MSRTVRNRRPQMKFGVLSYLQYKNGFVRDGTPTHLSSSCEHHGSCQWCTDNRIFSNKRREPIIDEIF